MEPVKPSLVAVVQMNSRDDVADNLRRAAALVREAAGRGALVVVLPEDVAYMGPDEGRLAVAERFTRGVVGEEQGHGPIGRWASALARETGAWVMLGGVPERVEGDDAHVHDAAVLLDAQGRVVGVYRSVRSSDLELATGARLRESGSVVAGDEVVAVDSPVGVLGLSIGQDVQFPELYRELVDKRATVLAVPAAVSVPTGRDHWHVLLRARAMESQCYVLAAAQWGSDGGGRTSYGHALVCDPWGVVLAECEDGEGFALAEIDVVRLRSVRAESGVYPRCFEGRADPPPPRSAPARSARGVQRARPRRAERRRLNVEVARTTLRPRRAPPCARRCSPSRRGCAAARGSRAA